MHSLVGYERQLNAGTLCRSEQYLLDNYRACVSVDPYFHLAQFCLNTLASKRPLRSVFETFAYRGFNSTLLPETAISYRIPRPRK